MEFETKENKEKNPVKKDSKKSFKTIFEQLLSKKISDEMRESLKGYMKSDRKDLSVYEAMALVQLTKALNGDTKAFELVRDTLGQKLPNQNDTAFGGVVKVMISDE